VNFYSASTPTKDPNVLHRHVKLLWNRKWL